MAIIYSPAERTKLSKLEEKYANACFVGDLDIVKYMIKKENKTFKRDILLCTCLNRASNGGHLDIFTLLFNYIKTRAPHIFKKFMFMNMAFKGCNTEIIDILINRPCSMNDLINGLIKICTTGKIDVFEKYLDKVSHTFVLQYTKYTRTDFFNTCLEHACMSDNNTDMIYYLIAKGATNWNRALCAACEMGCIKNVELMINYGADGADGADCWDLGLFHACVGGYVEIAEFMFQKGATFRYNCKYGRTDIINLLATKDIDDSDYNNNNRWNEGLVGACVGGFIEIAAFMIKNGATNLNEGLLKACVNDQPEVAKYMITSGANELIECLEVVCYYCYDLDLLKIITSKDNMVWDEGLRYACRGKNVEFVKFMLNHHSYTVNELNRALSCTNYDSVDIINLLLRKGGEYSKMFTTFLRIFMPNFKHHCMYNRMYNLPKNERYFECLAEYSPCVLFVGCKLTVSENCHVKKLPIELFKLLSEY